MSKTTGPITIHARSTGLTVPSDGIASGTEVGTPAGRVLYQGETVTLSPEQVDATRDRLGNSWLDLTPEEQVQRWGMQKFGIGPAPDGLVFGGDDSGYRFRQYERELKYSELISDPSERHAETQRIRRDFADVVPRQGGSIATYQEQR